MHGLVPTEWMQVPGSKGDAHTTRLSVNIDVAAVGQADVLLSRVLTVCIGSGRALDTVAAHTVKHPL